MGYMKTIKIGLSSIGAMILFTGCNNTSASPTTKLNQQVKVVREDGGYHYYVPINALGSHLDKKSAYLNRVITDGLLKCRENDAWITTKDGRRKSAEAGRQYNSILTPEERIIGQTHPTSIPRQDSQEYRNAVKVEKELVKTNQSYCVHPMSKADVKKHKDFVNDTK